MVEGIAKSKLAMIGARPLLANTRNQQTGCPASTRGILDVAAAVRILPARTEAERTPGEACQKCYGTVPHAGFGLGFERTVAYVTGLANVRDVIPFPRTPGNARY